MNLFRQNPSPGLCRLLCAMMVAGIAQSPGIAVAASTSIAAASSPHLRVDKTLTGKVIDEKNSPLPGVSVIIKGTSKGTTTGADGSFTLVVEDAAQTLTFSFIGYTSQDVAIGNQSAFNVTLLPSSEELTEVVVVGYGTQSTAAVTGAVSNIQAKDLIRTPSVGTSDALVGRVQGITARKADARPGAATTIQIRNLGTPLFVIDGIPSDAANFNNLGQNDIESVSILKDASAAVYGLRAANGVVLVTTKRGKAGDGPARINISGYYGLQNFTRYPKPASAYQHMRGLVESDVNQGRTPSITPEELAKWKAGTEKGYQSFDYYKMVMRPNVPQFSLNANVSGGTEKISYFLSVGHLNQDALIKDYNFKRTNVQANVESSITKRLKVGAQISARIEDRFQVGVPGLDDYFNPFLSIFTMWPTERPYANDNPKYINQTHNVNVNPATYKRDITGYIDEITRVVKGNFYAEYDFAFGLKVKGTYSYQYHNFDFDGFEYTYDAYNYDAATDKYNVVAGGGNQNPWRERRKRNIVDRFAQLQLNYSKTFGDHELSAVAAYEQSDNVNTYLVVHTVPPNNYIPLMSFANQDLLIDEWSTEARAGYIGRVNYNFKQKYLLEAVGRYDGSFLYAPGKRFGFFPGVSAGWRISEENFFKGKLENVFSSLKIRASYGRTGSDRNATVANEPFIVSPFSYLPGYNFLQGSAIFNGQYNIGVRPRGLPITTLSWITNISTNLGIDFGLLGGKLNGQVDIFQRKRDGLPAARYDVLLPSEVGYTLPNENLNSDTHRGIEGVLTYKSSVGQFDYTVSANATLSRRRDLDFYKPRFGNSYNEYRDSYVDRWGNINWGYQVEGQFQSQEQIESHPIDNDGQGNRTHLPGDFIYKDVNGDGIINGLDERPIGYAEGANPYLSFALNGSLSYKGFSLFADFAGASLQSFQRAFELKIPYQNNGTSPHFMLEDRWHREDPFDPNSKWIPGTYPAIRKDNSSHANFRKSDFWITNVRYIRLRNIEFGYSFDPKVFKKLGSSGLRVYVNASNLFSIDNVKKYEIDPEISSGNALVYPQQRLFNAGFSINF